MVEKEIMVNNPTGLHARPASQLVALAGKFKSKVTIQFNGKSVNVKSMLSLLGAGIKKSSQIVLVVEGEDETEAAEAISALIHSFDE